MSSLGVAARSAVWTIMSSLLSRGLGIVGTLILIRWVAPGDYGEVSAATVVVATINQFTTLGVGVYVIAHKDATREEIFHATFIHLLLGVVAFVGVLALARPISPWFGTPNLYHYVPGLAVAALAERVSLMPERVLIRQLKFRRISIVRSAAELVYTAVSTGLAFVGWGGISIVVGNVARSAVKTFGMATSVDLADWAKVVRLRMEVLRKIVKYSLTVTMAGLANFGIRRWDNLLVSRFFGPAVLGTYNLAYNLADIPAVHVGEQITDVMQASFAQMEREERRQALLRSLGVLALITFPIAIGLGAVGPTLADLFLNSKWAGVGAMLVVLSILSIVRPIHGALASYILVEMGPRLNLILEWMTLGLLMASIATLGRISPLWTCLAVGITFTARTAAAMVVVGARLGTGFGALMRELLPPLFACVPMAVAVFALRALFARLGVHAPAVILATEVIVGAGLFVGMAFLVARGPVGEVQALVRERRARRSAAAAAAAAAASEPVQEQPAPSP